MCLMAGPLSAVNLPILARCPCHHPRPGPRVSCQPRVIPHRQPSGQARNFQQITSLCLLRSRLLSSKLCSSRSGFVRIRMCLCLLKDLTQVILLSSTNIIIPVLLIPVIVSCCVHLSVRVISSILDIPPSGASHHQQVTEIGK